jgi:hypothetical protein
MNYTVIRDTREKEDFGWWFEIDEKCAGTVKGSLDTGDYTIQGYESVFSIERKANTGEVAQNIYEKRFIKELERLRDMRHPYIIMEFEIGDILRFPVNSGIPKKFWGRLKTTPQKLLKDLMTYQVKYGVPIIYAGSFGSDVATSLFKRIVEHA